ncbi:hypothetical protein NFI96_000090 [Prochilodus magdalenae]|nr:hypothetical protein NFI96_000090 [Prochilodus magdalenae]
MSIRAGTSYRWKTIQTSPKEQEAMENHDGSPSSTNSHVLPPELFVDLSQSSTYMSVSDIYEHFPASLIVNDSVSPEWTTHTLAVASDYGDAYYKPQLSHWLGLTSRTLNTSIWSSSELAALHGVLPQLGASFFQTLSSSELLELFSIPGIPTFPPAQAFQVLSRIAQDTKAQLLFKMIQQTGEQVTIENGAL